MTSGECNTELQKLNVREVVAVQLVMIAPALTGGVVRSIDKGLSCAEARS